MEFVDLDDTFPCSSNSSNNKTNIIDLNNLETNNDNKISLDFDNRETIDDFIYNGRKFNNKNLGNKKAYGNKFIKKEKQYKPSINLEIPSDQNNLNFKNKEINIEKIDLLDYLTSMKKLFNTYKKGVKEKYSEKIMEKTSKEFNNVAKTLEDNLGEKRFKNKNKCNKSNCNCENCPNIKKRYTAKKMFLTIPYTSIEKEKLMDYMKNKYNLCKIAIAQEIHKEAKQEYIDKYGTNKHIHIFIEWTAKKDIKNPDYMNLPDEYKIYGNTKTDIETIKKRTKENIYSYLLKTDKNVISWGFNIHTDVYGKLKKKELWYKLYTGEWSFKDIVKYDPSILLQNDIEKLYNRFFYNWNLLKNIDNNLNKRINWEF